MCFSENLVPARWYFLPPVVRKVAWRSVGTKQGRRRVRRGAQSNCINTFSRRPLACPYPVRSGPSVQWNPVKSTRERPSADRAGSRVQRPSSDLPSAHTANLWEGWSACPSVAFRPVRTLPVPCRCAVVPRARPSDSADVSRVNGALVRKTGRRLFDSALAPSMSARQTFRSSAPRRFSRGQRAVRVAAVGHRRSPIARRSGTTPRRFRQHFRRSSVSSAGNDFDRVWPSSPFDHPFFSPAARPSREC